VTSMARANIMLVEDDLSSGQAIKDLLEFLDYGVEWHRCAETVYDEFREQTWRPDLIVLDLGLGRVDGVTLVQRLRAEQPAMPPIVLFSATTESTIAKAVADTGAVGALRKPSGILELSQLLERALAPKPKPKPERRPPRGNGAQR
jgi:DNA-binding response OmpR family regulator